MGDGGLPSYLDSQEDAQVPGRDVCHAVLQLVGLSLGGRVSFLAWFGLRQITVVALELHSHVKVKVNARQMQTVCEAHT